MLEAAGAGPDPGGEGLTGPGPWERMAFTLARGEAARLALVDALPLEDALLWLALLGEHRGDE